MINPWLGTPSIEFWARGFPVFKAVALSQRPYPLVLAEYQRIETEAQMFWENEEEDLL